MSGGAFLRVLQWSREVAASKIVTVSASELITLWRAAWKQAPEVHTLACITEAMQDEILDISDISFLLFNASESTWPRKGKSKPEYQKWARWIYLSILGREGDESGIQATADAAKSSVIALIVRVIDMLQSEEYKRQKVSTDELSKVVRGGPRDMLGLKKLRRALREVRFMFYVAV